MAASALSCLWRAGFWAALLWAPAYLTLHAGLKPYFGPQLTDTRITIQVHYKYTIVWCVCRVGTPPARYPLNKYNDIEREKGREGACEARPDGGANGDRPEGPDDDAGLAAALAATDLLRL